MQARTWFSKKLVSAMFFWANFIKTMSGAAEYWKQIKINSEILTNILHSLFLQNMFCE